jgi:ubiquinone/menaquinone biosynthesis C-methylase UbiE
LDNLLNLELASLGFKVIGLDERECRDAHPNFKYIEGSGSQPPLADGNMDVVVALRQIGAVAPGPLALELPSEGDKQAMQNWQKVLKPGGTLILAIPFGQAAATAIQQIYHSRALDKLLEGWTVVVREFAIYSNQQAWIHPSPEAESSRTAVSNTGCTQAMALVVVRK